MTSRRYRAPVTLSSYRRASIIALDRPGGDLVLRDGHNGMQGLALSIPLHDIPTTGNVVILVVIVVARSALVVNLVAGLQLGHTVGIVVDNDAVFVAHHLIYIIDPDGRVGCAGLLDSQAGDDDRIICVL